MSKTSGCIKMLLIVAFTAIVLFWMAGAWLTNNVEKVTDAAVSTSGVKDVVARERSARCEQAKRQAQLAWERAVEKGDTDKSAELIEARDAMVKELCAK